MLALESLADAGIVVEALKLATNRQRPFVPPGTGKFWPDDTDVYSFSSSFPSGHAAASFAFARVIVEETPGHPWLHVALYGLATGVAIARVTGENHFPSDALVGSVIGYSVGGFAYHHHSAFYSPKIQIRTRRAALQPNDGVLRRSCLADSLAVFAASAVRRHSVSLDGDITRGKAAQRMYSPAKRQKSFV